MTAANEEKPCLKLFLSADLIGSTALKSEKAAGIGDPPWVGAFRQFYEEFPAEFRAKQKEHNCADQVAFWKGIGDELLWVATLREGNDAISILYAFKTAIEQYNKLLDEAKKRVRLKGSAWLAGFPINNRPVPLPSDGSGETRNDYIGPYIDIGFRLSKFSTRMRMVISIDLAWLILKLDRIDDPRDLHLEFEGVQPLKGVLGGRPYPVIWIQCDSPLEKLEYDLRIGKNKGNDWKKGLFEYCSNFIDDTSSHINRPYILEDPKINSNIPDSHKLRIQRMSVTNCDAATSTEDQPGNGNGNGLGDFGGEVQFVDNANQPPT